MSEYVGILRPFNRGGIVETGDRDLGDIWIPEQHLNGAPFGMQVVCEAEPPEPQKMSTGKIIEVLGDPSRPDVAIQGIIRSYGLSETFPAAVKAAAEKMPRDISETEISEELRAGRKDLRTLRTLTIDGLDAKDLDDALSFEALPDGNQRVYVHIADVTHYVAEGSPIDKEAAARGTSVYLVDRVIPMQPPALSNGICSLNPDKDRFALTVRLDYNSNGNFIRGDVFESIIRSDVRGNYDDVWEMIQNDKPITGYERIFDDLMALYRLSRQLRQKRLEAGSLNFESSETVVVLDSEGYPTDIYPEPQTEANELIEEFMIQANVYVAKRFEKMEAPFIYRVHETPDPDKIARFFTVAKRIGAKVRTPEEFTPQSLAVVLDEIRDHTYSAVLSQLLLQAQAKARYDAKCLGHFGLALQYYCHFTSPIRRYPDLFIHRVIKGYLRGRPHIKRWNAIAADRAEHASIMERVAMEAERDTVDQKVAEYMADHLGEIFEGTISGLTFGGMFVKLDNSAEGMVPYQTMSDYYVFSEEQMLVQGERSRRVFRIGDRVKIQVAKADTIRRLVDFVLVDENVEGEVEPVRIDDAEQERIRERSVAFRIRRREDRESQPLRAEDVINGNGRHFAGAEKSLDRKGKKSRKANSDKKTKKKKKNKKNRRKGKKGKH
ncbi:MAG TPA: ribonuclease R [Clostridiaceae bacterium]|nr:ribonuclease R [Clostridiaceae bacterium]